MHINTSILTIDDKSENISYCHSEIKTVHEHKMTLSDLLEIFEDEKSGIFNYDTTGAVTLIKDNGIEIPLFGYTDGDDIAFIKISDVILREYNCEILLSVNYLRKHAFPAYGEWQRDIPAEIFKIEKLLSSSDADKIMMSNIDGYDICIKNVLSLGKEIEKCTALETYINYKISCASHIYQGYLPSLYQLKIIMKCMQLIDCIMCWLGYENNAAGGMIGTSEICGMKVAGIDVSLWSAMINENDDTHAYAFDLYGDCRSVVKSFHIRILPIFKQLRNDENN